MVLNALKFDPKVLGPNQQPAQRVAFAGGGQEEQTVSHLGTGKGINAERSSGVHGEVTGTGENGKHRLNTYF